MNDRPKELRRDVHKQLEALRDMDQRLAEITSDEQDIAERECKPDEFDDYTEVQCDCKEQEPKRVTCGNCGTEWCERCDPAPSALCHVCHGRGHTTAPLKQGIVYPEHAAPEVDHARTLVQQAIEELEDWQSQHGEYDPAEFIEYATVITDEHCETCGAAPGETHPPACADHVDMVECPNCGEIELPETGGECTACHIPTYFT